ncbi:tRNAisopentenyltransferase 2 [Actinidia rufa]|uniref:tRNAisopentenyltransferase 2 n=1 Tax=Actinidia rufa TaxID=165716 RepID=A0A7J0G928_9ERIC|nr:tRNAisopentenyltransferase 2 [Actinidia rufa]
MEDGSATQREKNHKNGRSKPKVVVIMGATGSGKSRLAIDLASHFPIEIINADSMQVYQGLDVLTNKVPLQDQKGVPHHLLGTSSPSVEFTAKDFRDSAIPLIDDILSRKRLPVIVGGTNYYIQALVSPLLLDDSVEDMDDNCLSSLNVMTVLKDLDPVAANRIHPNDHRKINQYLSLYARSGVLPSNLLQGKAMEIMKYDDVEHLDLSLSPFLFVLFSSRCGLRQWQNWGRADNFRYDCCFICVDVSLPVLDKYVERRVDWMVDTGLLNEVFDIYNFNADYTRGLRQAIGVREFEDFLRVYLLEGQNGNVNDLNEASHFQMSTNKAGQILKENLRTILNSSDEKQLKLLLEDAIDKVKANTRRLVRRQKRRLIRLQTLFGWNIHYVDATESILCASDDLWVANVVQPSSRIVLSYLNDDESSVTDSEARTCTGGLKLMERDLWTQYICKACGNRVLRGAHEWEQHKQGRGHRKRISRLRKSGSFCLVE